MKYSKPEPGDDVKESIVVPWHIIEEQEEAERIQMHKDLESGRITPEELRKKNCIDWGDNIEVIPWYE